jgi:hypothetical protein
MSDHPWIQENLAAYLAGGLDAAEAGRLEQHVAGCKPCARLLEEGRHFDQSLKGLFADAQPEAGFEDRAIQRVRKVSQRRWPQVLRYMKYAAAAAAVLGVAGVGVTVNSLIGKDGLTFPDADRLSLAVGQSWIGGMTEPSGKYLPPPLREESLKAPEDDPRIMDWRSAWQNDHRTPVLPTEGVRPQVSVVDPEVTVKGQPAGSLMFGVNVASDRANSAADLEHYRRTEVPNLDTDHAPVGKKSVQEDTPMEDPVVPLPIGHDRMGKGGFYVGGEFVYSKQTNPIKDQVIATRGILDHDGSITANLNGTPGNPIGGKPAIVQGQGTPGTFIGSGAAALNSSQAEKDSRQNRSVDELSSTEDFGVEIRPKSPVLFQRGVYPATDLTAQIQKEIGNPREWARPGVFQRPGSPANNPAGGDGSGKEESRNLVSGLTPPGVTIGKLGSAGPVPKTGIELPGADSSPSEPPEPSRRFREWAANNKSGNDESVDPFPPGLQQSLGYTPPSKSLVNKGTSRVHTNLGNEPSIGPGPNKPLNNIGSYPGKDVLGRKYAPANEKLDYFKPGEVKFGEQGKPTQVATGKPVQNKSDAKEKDLKPLPTGGVAGTTFSTEYKQPKDGQAKSPPAASTPAPAAPRKVIIRTGEIEFEVVSFDAATAIVNRLVNAVPGGFVATTNSEKLPNGKVRGSVVVRVPPDHLDGLVDNLRKDLAKGGELKNQRIGSQDVTKQFTDLESRLRAARTMEERLLQIIKSGKGEIKDLLSVEKELGVWRTRIEEMEGELRFMAHQVALSTLTISITEKEIRAPYGMLETERINMGVEVGDVEKAQKQALTIVADVKGRITKSELKQLEAGQYSAVLNFEVPPDAAGPVRDRLNQLGKQARLDVNKLMEPEGGTGKPQDSKITRKDAQFFVSIYNLANVAPRETTYFDVATADAEAAYKAVLTRIQKLGGRVVTSNLNRQNNDQTMGTINFQVKAAEADGFDQELKAIGETLRHQTTESPDTANTTRSKRGFVLQILAYGSVPARETTTMQMATPDVPVSFRKLQEAIATAKGRMLSAQLNEQNRQNATATLDFEVRRENEAVVRTSLDSLGDVLARNVARVPENDNALNSKVRLQVTLIDAARIPPRETATLGLEVTDVDMASANFTSLVHEKGGRTVGSTASRERTGKVTSKLVFYVPLAASAELVERFKSVGVVRVLEKDRNPQVSDGSLAVARLDVTLSNSDLIVPSDQGLWPQIRKGLSTSFVGLSWSLTVVIIGILFVLPWLVAIWGGWRVVRWMRGAPKGA